MVWGPRDLGTAVPKHWSPCLLGHSKAGSDLSPLVLPLPTFPSSVSHKPLPQAGREQNFLRKMIWHQQTQQRSQARSHSHSTSQTGKSLAKASYEPRRRPLRKNSLKTTWQVYSGKIKHWRENANSWATPTASMPG